MRTSIINRVSILLLFIVGILPFPVLASHIVGGGFTYSYLGDTVVSGTTFQKYQVTLELYQDCVTGVPEAIAQDNPAFITIYESHTPAQFLLADSLFYDPTPGSGGSISVPFDSLKTKCGTIPSGNLPPICLLRKRFVKTYYFPASDSGYVVVYQRCCRNSSIANIIDPGDGGITFFCNIPPTTIHNSSAKFNGYPQQVACINTPMLFDVSATDTDGDSLSYAFCDAYIGSDALDIKPRIAAPPPYKTANYVTPYSSTNPMTGAPPITINEKTGVISVTPNYIGRYVIGVQCNEWRNSVLINTVKKEFQLMVINCGEIINSYKPYAGKDQTILVGQKVNFEATGGIKYLWLPGDFLDNPYIGNPIGTFTTPGEYSYVVTAENDSGCTGTDAITITVLEHSEYTAPNAFTPNGDGHNDVLRPIAIGGGTLKNFRVYNRWGNMIFYATNSADGWDGTAKGKEQDPGVYAWSAEYDDNTGTPRVSSGNVTLLR